MQQDWRVVAGRRYRVFLRRRQLDWRRLVAGSRRLRQFPSMNVALIGSLQNFASFRKIATGIYGNDSKAIFEVEGAGEDQWVSFYHQSQYSLSNTHIANH